MSTGTVRGKGQLMHHFHGDYWASIALVFNSILHASDALTVLGEGWVQSIKDREVLFWVGARDALEKVKEQLATFGADASKIDSVAHSIDFGDPFEVTIAVIPAEQGSLFTTGGPA